LTTSCTCTVSAHAHRGNCAAGALQKRRSVRRDASDSTALSQGHRSLRALPQHTHEVQEQQHDPRGSSLRHRCQARPPLDAHGVHAIHHRRLHRRPPAPFALLRIDESALAMTLASQCEEAPVATPTTTCVWWVLHEVIGPASRLISHMVVEGPTRIGASVLVAGNDMVERHGASGVSPCRCRFRKVARAGHKQPARHQGPVVR